MRKRKFLVRLETGKTGHTITGRLLKRGMPAEIFIENGDGTQQLHRGKISAVLADLQLSRREILLADRDELGLSHKQLARLFKIDPQSLYRWEAGKNQVPATASELLRVATWLASEHPEAWREWLQRINTTTPEEDDTINHSTR